MRFHPPFTWTGSTVIDGNRAVVACTDHERIAYWLSEVLNGKRTPVPCPNFRRYGPGTWDATGKEEKHYWSVNLGETWHEFAHEEQLSAPSEKATTDGGITQALVEMARENALEEAAIVCEEWPSSPLTAQKVTCLELAEAIRRLKRNDMSSGKATGSGLIQRLRDAADWIEKLERENLELQHDLENAASREAEGGRTAVASAITPGAPAVAAPFEDTLAVMGGTMPEKRHDSANQARTASESRNISPDARTVEQRAVNPLLAGANPVGGPTSAPSAERTTGCWICGEGHKDGHCRRAEAVAKCSDEALARWIFKHISFKEPRETEVEFLADVLREHWKQAQSSAQSARGVAIPAEVVKEADIMLHTCEHVTGLTEGQHVYDTEFVLRLCRAIVASDRAAPG